jgi:hypothetical protein
MAELPGKKVHFQWFGGMLLPGREDGAKALKLGFVWPLGWSPGFGVIILLYERDYLCELFTITCVKLCPTLVDREFLFEIPNLYSIQLLGLVHCFVKYTLRCKLLLSKEWGLCQ